MVESLVLQGQGYVSDRGCPTCHQSPDAADGTLSGSLTPVPGTMIYPRNLTPDPDTGIGTWSDAQKVRAIRTGIDDQGLQLCWVMPLFSELGDHEVDAIVAYLDSLPPVHHQIPNGICPPLGPADASVTPDLATPGDLALSGDLAAPADLATQVDQAAPADLAPPDDLAAPADLAQPDDGGPEDGMIPSRNLTGAGKTAGSVRSSPR